MPLPDLLRPLVAQPDRACLLCDFDGTVSAIVADPADAVALPGALDALARLAARLGSVAIISGRPAGFLAQQLAPIADAPIELHGMYGLETWQAGEAVPLPEAAPWRAVIDRIAAAAEREAPASVLVEPKGLSVALHYRGEPSDERWTLDWARRQADEHGLSLLSGRMAIELRPPLDRDKGDAARDLLAQHRPASVVFLGDDTGDLPIVAAIRAYASSNDAVAVAVCVDSAETPDELRQAADLRVDGPAAAVALLTELAGELER